MAKRERRFHYFEVIIALFTAALIIPNVASTKILKFGVFTFDGGTILFPIVYIFGDILTEVYGYRKSRKVIWTGFFSLFLFSLTMMIVQYLPPADGWGLQSCFESVLGLVPRIALASMVAYLVGEFSNSYVLAKMKIWTKGKYLWTRTIGSTIVGEFFDTGLFVIIAFAGVLEPSLLLTVALSNYVFKCGVEFVFTPLTYRVVGFLKNREKEDYYDYRTNFNPFNWK